MDLQDVGGEDGIDRAKDRDMWRAVKSEVMNLRVHKMRGISWLAENQLASRWHCSME